MNRTRTRNPNRRPGTAGQDGRGSAAPVRKVYSEDLSPRQTVTLWEELGIHSRQATQNGRPVWEAAGSHPLRTSDAVVGALNVGTDEEVGLFWDHSGGAVTADPGNPIWAKVERIRTAHPEA